MNTIRRAPLSEPVLMLFLFTASGNGNESADDEGLQTAIQLSLEEAQHANSTKLEEDKKSGKLEKEMEKQIDPELNIYLKNDKNTEDMLGSLLKGMGI